VDASGNIYIADAGDSRVLRIPVLANGNAGTVQIFADGATIDARQHTTEALHGADGLAPSSAQRPQPAPFFLATAARAVGPEHDGTAEASRGPPAGELLS